MGQSAATSDILIPESQYDVGVVLPVSVNPNEQHVGNSTEHMYLLIHVFLLLRETRGLFTKLTLKGGLNLETSNLFAKTVLLDAESRRSFRKGESESQYTATTQDRTSSYPN